MAAPSTPVPDPYSVARNPDGSRDERLVALMKRAEHIGETSGRAPMSWADFRDKMEVGSLGSTAEFTGKLALGATTGVMIGVLGAALALNPVLVTLLAIGGAVVGGSVGNRRAIYDVDQHKQLVDKYEQYLNGCEHMADQGHAVLQQQGIAPKMDHVARLQQRQQNAQGSQLIH